MRHLFLLFATLCLTNAYAHNSSSQNDEMTNETRSEKHQEREQAREQRAAAMTAHIDSMILSKNYDFIPITYSLQPAGMPRNVVNPLFMLEIYNNFIDIYLPYIKGVTPPYINTILNYTIPLTSIYVAETTKDGWLITFSSSLFSENKYTFSIEVISSTGEATLNLSSDLYNTVTYNGRIGIRQ